MKEYIGDTKEGKNQLRDTVIVYHKPFWQPQYQQLKDKRHLRVCGKDEFQVFPFLQMRSQNTNLR